MELQIIPKHYSISWKNIYYEIQDISKKGKKDDRKIILNNVSGYANSQEITAVMGPSGSGKTSLLNFLTNRINIKSTDKHSGELYVNSEEKTYKFMEDVSSYVMQDDLLFDTLTPRETFIIVSMLRKKQPKKAPNAS